VSDHRCTRCFGVRDREPVTFVETFTDSAWCTDCLADWLVGDKHLREVSEGFDRGGDTAVEPRLPVQHERAFVVG